MKRATSSVRSKPLSVFLISRFSSSDHACLNNNDAVVARVVNGNRADVPPDQWWYARWWNEPETPTGQTHSRYVVFDSPFPVLHRLLGARLAGGWFHDSSTQVPGVRGEIKSR